MTIENEIRDALGVQPGWRALPRLEDDRVVIEFRPPRHRRSLAGILSDQTTVRIPTDEEFQAAGERAREEAVHEDWQAQLPPETSDVGWNNVAKKEGVAMAIEANVDRKKPAAHDRPFAHLRATPVELARVLAAAQPFDVESWQRGAVPPTPGELADLEDFLRELDEMRQQDLKRQEERLAELGE